MRKGKCRGDRFRLLVYSRMWQRWALPCVLIVPASLVLWIYVPQISIIQISYRHAALVPAGIALLILMYAMLASQQSWVQCRPDHIHIQAPLCPLALSYTRIKGVRPKRFAEVFNLRGEKSARLHWLEPFIGATVIVVELSSYPLPRRWLRLWFSPYLLDPRTTGFVFLVDDWIKLSRQIDEFRITRHIGQARQKGANRLTSRL